MMYTGNEIPLIDTGLSKEGCQSPVLLRAHQTCLPQMNQLSEICEEELLLEQFSLSKE